MSSTGRCTSTTTVVIQTGTAPDQRKGTNGKKSKETKRRWMKTDDTHYHHIKWERDMVKEKKGESEGRRVDEGLGVTDLREIRHWGNARVCHATTIRRPCQALVSCVPRRAKRFRPAPEPLDKGYRPGSSPTRNPDYQMHWYRRTMVFGKKRREGGGGEDGV